MDELFRGKHLAWLWFLYGSFALARGEEAEILEDFAAIHFRHLRWIAQKILEEGGDFDWDREPLRLEYTNARALYEDLTRLLGGSYPEGALFDRIRSDEAFMAYRLSHLPDRAITAFDRHLRYRDLEGERLEALVRFLFEESYKEYELIVTYTYSQLHTEDGTIRQVFADLVDESLYHLKSFALLQAKLGILSVPRPVMREVYRFDDLAKFLREGIEEEKAAKEECRRLAEAVGDEELRRFFAFIDAQESYHIHLMERVLERLGE